MTTTNTTTTHDIASRTTTMSNAYKNGPNDGLYRRLGHWYVFFSLMFKLTNVYFIFQVLNGTGKRRKETKAGARDASVSQALVSVVCSLFYFFYFITLLTFIYTNRLRVRQPLSLHAATQATTTATDGHPTHFTMLRLPHHNGDEQQMTNGVFKFFLLIYYLCSFFLFF
jgi:hypothetical protein